MPRKSIAQSTEREVLIRSKRRCAMCFGLSKDMAIKQGQIAHIDKDNANAALDNLVFLCFNHHDEYDSITRQSKGITAFELKYYRDELHSYIQDSSGTENDSEDIEIQNGACRVQIKINLDDMGQRERNLLVHGLANFLDISTQDVEIVEINQGSICVTLDLPTRSVGRLLVSDLKELSDSIELDIISLEIKQTHQEVETQDLRAKQVLHKLSELQKAYLCLSKANPNPNSARFKAENRFSELIQSLNEARFFEKLEAMSVFLKNQSGEEMYQLFKNNEAEFDEFFNLQLAGGEDKGQTDDSYFKVNKVQDLLRQKEVYQFSKNLREKLLEIHSAYCRTIDSVRVQPRKRKKRHKSSLNSAILRAMTGLKALASINNSAKFSAAGSFLVATTIAIEGFNSVTGHMQNQ
jgi:hypothetical protein